jgi:AcrR family transcriptional regulator
MTAAANPGRDADYGEESTVIPLRVRQRMETRRSLVDAARRNFADRGYASTTIEEIARSAGASRATFYLHFKTKNDIVEAILEPFRRRSYELGRRVRDVTRMTSSDVSQWVSDWAQAYAEHTDDLRVTSIAMASDSSLAIRLGADVPRLITDLADEHPRLRETAVANKAEVLIRLMFSSLNTYCHDHFVRGFYDLDELVTETSASWQAYFIPQLCRVIADKD